MTNFNLITKPWIPIRTLEQGSVLVSLTTLFKDAAQIADLDVAPHERIALLRLLICITQAALGAPATPKNWAGFGANSATAIPEYLHRPEVMPYFDLFGDGPRFLQSPVDETDKTYPISQMVCDLADGNSPTLLDHAGGSDRSFPPDFIARALLAYQNFFVGGSMASKVKGNGPCLKMLHTYFTGKNLQETILFNCLDSETVAGSKQTLGQPVWACANEAELKQNVDTYLGRLVPLTCRLRLHPDQNQVWIEDGFACSDYPQVRDAFATIVTRPIKGKEEQVYLRADLKRGLWTDLHLITMLKLQGKESTAGPKVLQSHSRQLKERSARLWLSELYKAKDAKIIDSLQSYFQVPVQLFEEEGRVDYENAVEYANTKSTQLYRAVKDYGKALQEESRPHEAAQRHFWTALEQKSAVILDMIRDQVPRADDFGKGQDEWTLAVKTATKRAYEFACPHETPRQLQAYVAGLKVLYPKPKK